MIARPYNVLFLCTGNSARSILAEAILRASDPRRFKGYSAGSHPAGAVSPLALEFLERYHLPTEGLRSKSWDEFAGADAPRLDFVFTVCDTAAAEACPVWPGQPMTAHWGVPDPVAVAGSDAERRAAFKQAFILLDRRIRLFLALPLEKLDRLKLGDRLKAIGQERLRDPGTERDGRRVFTVLFLSQGNSARGLMAESLLNEEGHGRFRALSAGERPKGHADPRALELLRSAALPVEGLRSKSRTELVAHGAQAPDLVISLWDQAGGEACPSWQGQPEGARWNVEDPARFGSPEEARVAYGRSFAALRRNIELLVFLPRESLEALSISGRAAKDGKS